MLRVAILFGGRSAEHEVSLRSARNVLLALDRKQFEPVLVGIDRDGHWHAAPEGLLLDAPSLAPELADAGPTLALEPGAGAALTLPAASIVPGRGQAEFGKIDVVFPVLHGTLGEDGTVQGLLELLDLPYVGAGVLGSALGMDKDVMKRLLCCAEIPIARYLVLRAYEFETDRRAALSAAEGLGFPLFSKPANLGSSVGIRRVETRRDLEQALEHAFEYDLKVIVEEAIAGRELECSVLGNDLPQASLPGEVVVRHPDGFYSYEAKYLDENGAKLRIPADLAPAEIETVQRLAVRTFRALECRGLARVDFFLEPEGRLLVNEINTLPGFTSISMYPKLWEASGLTPTALVTRLIQLALEHKERQRGLAVCRT